MRENYKRIFANLSAYKRLSKIECTYLYDAFLTLNTQHGQHQH